MIVLERASPLLLAVFLLSIVAAAAVDMRYRRVPNLLVIVAALSGIGAFVMTGNTSLLWHPLLVAAAILAVGVPMFARGWVGGGDVKLLAAAACWFTADGALRFVASVFLAGGVLALLFIGSRLVLRKRTARHSAAGLPYAVAIAAGAAAQVLIYRF